MKDGRDEASKPFPLLAHYSPKASLGRPGRAFAAHFDPAPRRDGRDLGVALSPGTD
jgi:hypothetical protein